MKRLVCSILLALVLGVPLQSQQGERVKATNRITVRNVRLTAPRLVELLNNGYVQELNKLDGGSNQPLTLRLWQIPKEGNCMPDTHYVCSYRYYLAVNPNEEGFEGSVYDLGEIGEISDVKWQKSDVPQTVKLSIQVTNYPREYLKDNKNLVKRERRYELVVTTEKLVVKGQK